MHLRYHVREVTVASPLGDADLLGDHADGGLGVAAFGEQPQASRLDGLLERDGLRLPPGRSLRGQLLAPSLLRD
jgi:hypothetical protein